MIGPNHRTPSETLVARVLREWERRERLWKTGNPIPQGAIPIAEALGLDREVVAKILEEEVEVGVCFPTERKKQRTKKEDEMTTTIEKCKHILTRDETREKADSLARKMGEIDGLREQKKEICSRIKSDVDRLANETKALALAVVSGYEYRDTECAVEMDFSKNEVRVVRLDTKEVLRSRTMTATERQADLSFQEKAEIINHDKDEEKRKMVDRMTGAGKSVSLKGSGKMVKKEKVDA
jgi:fructose/tagatose bisphosphate aldolase